VQARPQMLQVAVEGLFEEFGDVAVAEGVDDVHTGSAMDRAVSDPAPETADAVIVRDELATVAGGR
jgi:hypothetical protein